jgi:hypothetical protein|tara:strand:- start:97 stop:624 length:528 start_codon:yes stop_codon:yes gene_type:complete
MAIFSKNIITAHFINEDYTIIEILYKVKDDVHSHVVETDPTQLDYKALVAEGWDVDKLAKSTEQYKRDQSFEFNNAIQASVDTILEQSKIAIKQEFLDEQAKNPDVLDTRSSNPYLSGDMFDIILRGNTDKDMLFKFKLWALEVDNIKTGTKALKTEIRKSKSILEGMAIIAPLI